MDSTLRDCLNLSSGTIGNIINTTDYKKIDAFQEKLVLFVVEQYKKGIYYKNWIDAIKNI